MQRALRKAIRTDGTLDIEALLAVHAAVLGNARMKGDEDDDKDVKDDDDTGDGGDDEDDDEDDPDAEKLGDAGKRALDRQKDRAKRERDRRKALEQELATERAKKGKDDDKGPSADEIREEARREARLEALRENLPDKIEARAARLAGKPRLVRALVRDEFDLDDFIDGGKVDVDAIDDAIEQILKDNPELGRDGGKKDDDDSGDGKKRRFGGGADGGTRNNGKGRAEQLTRAQLKDMTPAEIEKARRDGRLSDLMAGKAS
jgi:hypothetical protein